MNPKQISAIIVVVVVTIVSKYVWRFVKRKVIDNTNDFVIRQPSSYIKILALALMGLSFVTIFLLIFEKEAFSDVGGAIAGMSFIGILFLLTLFLLINTINWKLELFDSYCIHTNWIGKKSEFKYENLIVVNVNSGYRVYLGKKRVFDVSNFQDNYKTFVRLYSQHKKIVKRKK